MTEVIASDLGNAPSAPPVKAYPIARSCYPSRTFVPFKNLLRAPIVSLRLSRRTRVSVCLPPHGRRIWFVSACSPVHALPDGTEVVGVEYQNVSGDELEAAILAGNGSDFATLLSQDNSLAGLVDSSGVSLLLRSLYVWRLDIMELILQQRSSLNIFEAAALGKETVVAQRLALDPTEANSWSPDGMSALHLACIYGHTSVVRLLLDQGANPSAVARDGTAATPLHEAVFRGFADIVILLLGRGADLDAKQNRGWSALHVAAHYGYADLVRQLIERGASADLRDEAGKTPHDLAVASGYLEAAKEIELRLSGKFQPLPAVSAEEHTTTQHLGA